MAKASFQPFSIQTQPAQDHFLNDTLRLFSGIEIGHMNPHAFNEPDLTLSFDPVQGGKHWGDFIAHSKDYYVINEEIAAIQKFAPYIASTLPEGAIYVDLGPGEEKAVKGKTLPFLRALRTPKEFIAADINAEFAQNAAQTVLQETGIPSQAIKGDFLSENLNLVPDEAAIMTLFGGLLANGGKITGQSSAEKLSETFNNLAHNMKPGDYLVITQDANQDETSLLSAYTHPDLARYILSTLHKIKRDLPTENFNPDAFEFVSNWIPAEHLITLSARLRPTPEGMPLCFKIAGTPFTIREGQEIPLVNCYKYPLQTFLQSAKEAGFSSHGLYKNAGDRIAIHVLQFDPDNQP